MQRNDRANVFHAPRQNGVNPWLNISKRKLTIFISIFRPSITLCIGQGNDRGRNRDGSTIRLGQDDFSLNRSVFCLTNPLVDQ
jgi:hypothetical protein